MTAERLTHFRFDHLDPVLEQWEAIKQYNRLMRDALPVGARNFVLSEWHYHYDDPRCPHDSWIKSISFTYSDSTSVISEVNLQLLGAYHDRIILFRYLDVSHLLLDGELISQEGRDLEWIYDEVHLFDSGLVQHVIEFGHSIIMRIQCRDLVYESELLDRQPRSD